MMKFFLFMIFMIPFSLMQDMFWVVQFMFFFLFVLFLFSNSWSVTFMDMSYFMGCDFVSYSLILLSLWVCGLMMMASEKVYKEYFFDKFFCFVMIVLMVSLFLTFSSVNLFVFYVFFEVSLIPTLILILGWGYQPERIQAGKYMFFYTLLASLPMMVSIFYLYSTLDSLDYSFFFY